MLDINVTGPIVEIVDEANGKWGILNLDVIMNIQFTENQEKMFIYFDSPQTKLEMPIEDGRVIRDQIREYYYYGKVQKTPKNNENNVQRKAVRSS